MIRSSLLSALLASVAATTFGLVAAPGAAAAGCPDGFACSTVTVPLDRTGQRPGTVPLRVARHRASAGQGKPVLMWLQGGPGGAAIPFAERMAEAYGDVLDRYQLVLFDQRGTGESAPVDCPGLQRAGEFPGYETGLRVTTECGAQLGAAAGDYPTQDSVADLDAVRAAVGADKLALVGVSYGTHLIQRYLLSHPERVDRIVLDSVVAPGGVDAFMTASYGASERILRQLGGVAAVEESRTLARRLDSAPLRGSIPAGGGRRRTVTLPSSDDLFNLFAGGDTQPLLREQYRAAVRAANAGRPGPLLRLYALASSAGVNPIDFVSMGVFAAASCTDVAMPWAPTSDPATRPPLFDQAAAALDPAAAGAFTTTAMRGTAIAGMCQGWPAVPREPDSVPEAYPTVPALVLNGRSDVRTPIESARAVAERIAGSTFVAVAGTGHAVISGDRSGCAIEAAKTFLAGGSAAEACAGVDNGLDGALTDYPRRLSDLRPYPTTKGRPGRLLQAAMTAAIDGFHAAHMANGEPAPGVAGGVVRKVQTERELEFRYRGYELLPGLRVTGTLVSRQRALGTLRIGGIAKGTMRWTLKRTIARIDGKRLSAPR